VPWNRTRDPCICNQVLWPLDHRGGPSGVLYIYIYIYTKMLKIDLWFSLNTGATRCTKPRLRWWEVSKKTVQMQTTVVMSWYLSEGKSRDCTAMIICVQARDVNKHLLTSSAKTYSVGPVDRASPYLRTPSQNQGHVTTDGQSVSMSWCQVHSETRDQILYSVWKLLCCLCGAPSLTRGRVCFLSVTVSCIKSISIYILHAPHVLCICNIYKASV
jgi:hypothetical protein